MPTRWTKEEEEVYRAELHQLYIVENKTIEEIASILQLSGFQTVFARLKRLQIPTCRHKKLRADNRRTDVAIPGYSSELAEVFGILLGDGCLTHFQVQVTLGTKEASYAKYVAALLRQVFGGKPKVALLGSGYITVYLGSTLITEWLFEEGLVRNKVAAQVGVPEWIFEREEYMESFIRGFFDTDGSVYAIRSGIQISLTNASIPLLLALQKMLSALEYYPSSISCRKVYLTRKKDIARFFREIKPANRKHIRRYQEICKRRWQSGKCT